jgi:type II secretory pathway component PulL
MDWIEQTRPLTVKSTLRRTNTVIVIAVIVTIYDMMSQLFHVHSQGKQLKRKR